MENKNSKNRIYMSIIIVLVLVIALEPFVSLRVGNKMILSQAQYESMKKIYDKYSRQEKIVDVIKSQFLYIPDDNKIKEESLRGAIEGFGDPYTCYLSPQEYTEFLSSIKGVFVGIGAVVKNLEEDNAFVIENVLPDSAALKAGLKTGDKIIKIDNKTINTRTETLDTVLGKIRGKQGESVKISVLRDGKELDFDIIRQEVKVPSVYSKLVNNIGVIKLLSFEVGSNKEFKNAMSFLLEKGIKKLVIDLRDNPGGLLDEAVEISSLFLAENTTVAYTQNNKNQKNEIKTAKKIKLNFSSESTKNILESAKNLKIAILVNKNSASASELFSGMMKEYGLATIVGETTFGKGVVQNFKLFKDGSAIKFTSEEYFTPFGTKINKNGVVPDIDLKEEMESSNKVISYDLEDISGDVCFEKAFEFLNKK